MTLEDETARVEPVAGVQLDAFVLEAHLGSGAMGKVYRGRHGPSGTPVAVKVLSAEHADEASRVAFRREVQTAAALHHRHVVTVYDHGTVPNEAGVVGIPVGAPYLVMALAEGGSLLRHARGLDWPSVATLLFQLLDALAHAHARGVVHCDLKPENVLLLLENQTVVPALADFGIAHAFRTVMATAGVARVRGTPQFMAPEQFVAPRDIGPATDLYALGCMAYELVCRRLPFEAPTALALGIAHVRGPRPVFAPAIEVPDRLGGWIARLLQPDWRARFAGAAEAAFALSRFAEPGQAALVDWDRVGVPSLELAPFPTLPMLGSPAVEIQSQPAEPAERARVPQTWRRVDPLPSAALAGVGRGLFGLRPVPFVAREAERDRIWQALQAVNDHGEVRVVVLEGQTGTGKSRLAEWVAQRAEEVGGGRLFMTRHARVGTVAHGISGLLRRVIRPTLSDADRSRVGRLRGGDEPTAADAFILSEAGLQTSATLPPGRRFAAVLAWLKAVARPRPLVLWLDDVQWGQDSLGLVAELLRNPTPALVLLTVQGEGAGIAQLSEITNDSRVDVIELQPLSRAEHGDLVRSLLPLGAEAVAHVVARTEGHPLFAVQLVAAWVAGDLLRAEEGGFEIVPGASTMLPDDIHALWSARIEEAVRIHGPDARKIIELAAVLGSEVSLDEWAAVAEEAQLSADSVLTDGLQRLGLARRTSDGFAFAHRMLRESTLRLAGEAGRLEAWHHLCGRVLERQSTPGVGERVAEHFRAAGDGEGVARALLQACQAYTTDNYYHHVLRVAEQLQAQLDALGAPPDDPRRLKLELILIMPRFVGGDLACLARLDAVEAAVIRQGMEAERATILRIRGVIARTGGDYDGAQHLLNEAEARLRAVGDRVQSGRAALGQVFLSQRVGDAPGALDCLRRAVADFQAAGDAIWLLTARYEQGRMFFHLGDFDQAAEVANAVIRGALALGDEVNQARALVLLADLDRVRDRLGPAEEAYRQAGAIYLRTGNVNAALTDGELASVAFLRGRYAEADGLAQRCLAALAPTPYARAYWPLPLIQAVAAQAAGDRPRAEACLALGLANAEIASGEARSYIHLAERCAVALQSLGEPIGARQVGLLAVRLFGRMGDLGGVARVRRSLGLDA